MLFESVRKTTILMTKRTPESFSTYLPWMYLSDWPSSQLLFTWLLFLLWDVLLKNCECNLITILNILWSLDITRLAVNGVKPWLTKMINSSSSNTMILIGNWTWDISLTPQTTWLLQLLKVVGSWKPSPGSCRTTPCPFSYCPPGQSSGLDG